MAATYTPIATSTLSSAATGVTFSSIPSGYTDLIIVCSIKSGTIDSLRMQFNSDTGTNYSFTGINGSGTAASYWNASNQAKIEIYTPSDASEYTPFILQFNNYSNSTTYKNVIIRGGSVTASNTDKGAKAMIGLWRNTSAINTIYLYNGTTNNWLTGCSFTLYGIQAA